MSYQVLARKWRPQKFSELVGQEHVVEAISNALDNNRLHHAYLFTGTRGVGKTTIARIFAKSLNCESGQSANPCGKCATCEDIEQGRFVDLLEIDAASRTKVEDTRELLDNVQYRPTRGEFKVYLIDEVHMLSKHSFNALLKTLEEPPPHVKFLLATTDPQKLPITILSRCLQFNLKALSREQISVQLEHVLSDEQLPFEKPALSLIARAAHGSMRDALSLTDQAIAQGNNQVTQTVVTDMLGLLDRNHILRIAQALANGDNQSILALVDELAAHAPDFQQVLNELNATLHQIALTQIVPDACRLETAHAKAIYQLAKTFSAEHVQLLYQIGIEGMRSLSHAPDPRTGVEMALLRMMAFTPRAQLADVEQTIRESAPQIQSKPAETPVPNQAPAPVAPTMPKTDAPAAPQASEINSVEQTPVSLEAEPQTLSAEAVNDVDASLMALDMQQQAIEEQAHQMRDEPESYQPDESASQSQSEDAANLARTKAMLEMQQRMFQQPAQEASEGAKKSEPAAETLTPESPAESVEVAQAGPESQNNKGEDDRAARETADERPPWDEPEHTQPLEKVKSSDQTPSAVTSSDSELVESTPEVAALAKINTQADLPVFLENGDKLVFAAQIDEWASIIESLQVRGLVKQVALNSSFTRGGDTITLLLEADQQHLLSDGILEQLRQALAAHLDAPIQIDIQIGQPEQTPYGLQQRIEQMRHNYAHSVVESNEAINHLMTTFNANVVTDTIKPR